MDPTDRRGVATHQFFSVFAMFEFKTFDLVVKTFDREERWLSTKKSHTIYLGIFVHVLFLQVGDHIDGILLRLSHLIT